jgi:hypothetical protein
MYHLILYKLLKILLVALIKWLQNDEEESSEMDKFCRL